MSSDEADFSAGFGGEFDKEWAEAMSKMRDYASSKITSIPNFWFLSNASEEFFNGMLAAFRHSIVPIFDTITSVSPKLTPAQAEAFYASIRNGVVQFYKDIETARSTYKTGPPTVKSESLGRSSVITSYVVRTQEELEICNRVADIVFNRSDPSGANNLKTSFNNKILRTILKQTLEDCAATPVTFPGILAKKVGTTGSRRYFVSDLMGAVPEKGIKILQYIIKLYEIPGFSQDVETIKLQGEEFEISDEKFEKIGDWKIPSSFNTAEAFTSPDMMNMIVARIKTILDNVSKNEGGRAATMLDSAANHPRLLQTMIWWRETYPRLDLSQEGDAYRTYTYMWSNVAAMFRSQDMTPAKAMESAKERNLDNQLQVFIQRVVTSHLSMNTPWPYVNSPRAARAASLYDVTNSAFQMECNYLPELSTSNNPKSYEAVVIIQELLNKIPSRKVNIRQAVENSRNLAMHHLSMAEDLFGYGFGATSRVRPQFRLEGASTQTYPRLAVNTAKDKGSDVPFPFNTGSAGVFSFMSWGARPKTGKS